jgi:hypothetical protein
MPRAKRSIQSVVNIDGIDLVWNLHREQHLSTEDGWRGIAIHVKVAQGVRRELHLEYPSIMTEKMSVLKTDAARPTISAAKVKAHIQQAIAAGWDPESRGKPYVYELDELPG